MLRNARYLFITALFLPVFASAAVNSVGIPTGGIWFSKEPFFVGDQITVNTLVFNASPDVIRGSLELLDGLTILQQKDIAVDSGDSKVLSFPVQVTRGKHSYHIRVAGGDFTGAGGTSISVKTTGDYVAQTALLNREASVNPTLAALPAGAASTSVVDIATTTVITGKDAQGLADTIEQVLPAKVVEPVVNFAVPIIGATESFRVDQANANTKRIDGTIGDIAKQIGIAKVLGVSTEATTTGKASLQALPEKTSAWSIFGKGVTSGNFIQSPFGYIKLFFFLLYHAIVSAAWLFYGLSALILVKIFLYVKSLIFPAAV